MSWNARAKYGNRRTERDGIMFASKREADRWSELQVLLAAGVISNLLRQVLYDLRCAPVSGGPTKVARYVADFVYWDDAGMLHVEDAKGVRTPMYRLKAKWLLMEYGIKVEEV